MNATGPNRPATTSRSGDAHARNPAAMRRRSDAGAASFGAVARASNAPDSACVRVSTDADCRVFPEGSRGACVFQGASNDLTTAANPGSDSIIFRAAATSWSYAIVITPSSRYARNNQRHALGLLRGFVRLTQRRFAHEKNVRPKTLAAPGTACIDADCHLS